jgi:serine/threonine protein kinase
MHSKGVMHRDLKPGNIMVKNKKLLKICDFGCARTSHEVKSSQKREIEFDSDDLDEVYEAPSLGKKYSVQAIGTDWYRAPEIDSGYYNDKVDIWSVGCILTEFLSAP